MTTHHFILFDDEDSIDFIISCSARRSDESAGAGGRSFRATYRLPQRYPRCRQ